MLHHMWTGFDLAFPCYCIQTFPPILAVIFMRKDLFTVQIFIMIDSLFITDLLGYNLHTIKFTFSAVFNVFSKLFHCRCYWIFEYFITPKDPLYPLAVIFLPPFSQPLTTTNLLSVSGFPYSGHLRQIESYSRQPLVSDISHLSYIQGSCCNMY